MPLLKAEVRPLAEVLDTLTREGECYERLEENKVRCWACGHRCLILPGHRGICQVRFNKDGRLRVPWGYVAALQADPIEKKPLFHFLPGSVALTFGMLGCDYHCPYCQNWITSQALRDPAARAQPYEVSPATLVRIAVHEGARVVASSYNEPLITSEWAVAVFKEARQRSLRTAYISNGNSTPEVLAYLRPHLDAYKIDLKSFNDRSYRRLGGVLERVLDTIRRTFQMGYWVEVVTLLVPGFNDGEEELHSAARFLASISPDIPWHITAFHPDYKMQDTAATPTHRLVWACGIARQHGLRFVYAGNLPGRVGPYEHTFCPSCGRRLIARWGFTVLEYALTPHGTCPSCGRPIPGVWAGADGRIVHIPMEGQPALG
ncbi:MAG: AmmeMemoRadiSam system radical SAM enzyme [Dehalococcoidia bacterium]|nr:AmmeMemoRadiSam system radical SAM enzyme [Dehalococcoidia bacterium]MDW8119120.1 AmmeMemoRadiSam system radical SAM enzyme [Chloroflexota bacterium]